MTRDRRLAAGALAASALALCSLPLLGQEAPPAPGPAPGPAPAQPTQETQDRFLLHLSTDRPSYRPGETVRLRGLLLHALTRVPHQGNTWCTVEVRSPRGDVVTSSATATDGGALGLEWPVPPGSSGGRYTLKVSPQTGYAPSEVSFEVRAFRLPRLTTDLQFVRRAYGPGDVVEASLSVTRAEGGVPAGARCTAIARVDGNEVHRASVALDAQGRALVRFTLPAAIEREDATLACVIEDGGVQETASKTIPLVLARVRLELFPEGGDLVQGVPSRVYVEARTTTDDPADVRGRVLDRDGRVVAAVATEHEGRGRFTLLPQDAGPYELVIDEPPGVTQRFTLPPAVPRGLVLGAACDVVAPGAPLRLTVAGNLPGGRGTVAVHARDHEVASREVALGPAPVEVAVAVPAWAAGALRVTLLDAAGVPRAERLVFRRPVEGVRARVSLSPEASVPGAPVRVRVETVDTSGRPVDALVSLAVVDDAALQRIDRRERAPRLPAQVLLEAEVRELRDAGVYLDDAERGPLATDLLLGTQGWRRFAWLRRDAFAAAHGDAAQRVLAPQGVTIAYPCAEACLADAEGGWGGGGPGDGAVRRAGGPPAPMPDVAPEPQGAPQVHDAREDNAEIDVDGDREDDVVAGFMEIDGLAGRDEEEGRRARRQIPPALTIVRQYAHPRGEASRQERRDFAETVAWTAGLATGPDGVLELDFGLSDSVTTFRALCDVVARDGSLAWAEATCTARRAFYVEPKVPLALTVGDEVDLPLGLVNSTPGTLGATLGVEVEGALELVAAPGAVTIGPDSRVRRTIRVRARGAGEGTVRVRADAAGPGCQGARDDVARTVRVVPRGFPFELAWGGRLSSERPVTARITIPAGTSPGSLEARATVHPTPLASLQAAVAALVGEPGGCFEQTSATHYPNVMALRYLRSHDGCDPALLARTAATVERGYQRLVSFECSQRGYEWFGGDPGHEALTAYGLLEFLDTGAVATIDRGMLERTRAWLLARRDGQGGFRRNSQALDCFGAAPEETTNAYIVWALSEAGETGCAAEVERVVTGALASEDSYVIALAANACLRLGDAARARDLLRKLARAQVAAGPDAGSVGGAVTSITRSGGESLVIETTALAVCGWLRQPELTAHAERAMEWLLERCKAGRFGSTQATVLALRALVDYDAAHAAPGAAGTVVLSVDGQVVDEVPFAADASSAIELPSFLQALTPGAHDVSLRMVGGAPMPCSVVVRYRSETPPSSERCAVDVATSLRQTTVREGEATELLVRVTNRTAEGQPMTIAVVGVPGGLEVRADRLEELRRAGAFDFAETRDGEVVLYWRDLAPREVREVALGVVAQVPGRYVGTASRGYLYYTDEHKRWVPGLAATVVPRS